MFPKGSTRSNFFSVSILSIWAWPAPFSLWQPFSFGLFIPYGGRPIKGSEIRTEKTGGFIAGSAFCLD
jgi:hypothetical protein